MPPMGFIQSELDLKLLVLYLMARAAGPLTFLQLLDLALCDAGVDYFSLTQAVGHMVETGQLSLEGDRYSITDKGRHNSQICENSLPYSVRLRCDKNLAQLNEVLRREAQVQAKIQGNGDGTCTLQLTLDDVATPLLRLELLVPDGDQAHAMARRFQIDPSSVYHSIIRLLDLSGDPEQGGPS